MVILCVSPYVVGGWQEHTTRDTYIFYKLSETDGFFFPSLSSQLLSQDHKLVRTMNETSNDFEPDYIYHRQLGRGYEGQADVYTCQRTRKTVIIKTFFSTTRMDSAPREVVDRLQLEHNITANKWPSDITATLRRYNNGLSAGSGEDLTVNAIDAFYVPSNSTDPSRPLLWKMVLPLYAGALDSPTEALSYLNMSTSAIDFLYRPRYRTVFEGLARMHTTRDPALNNSGFCHDDIKLDNLFLRNEQHEIVLGDMGQTRTLDDQFHRGWIDCRLVDAHRAWKSYLVLIRDASMRGRGPSEFDAQFATRTTEWAAAYWRWVEEDTALPQNMLEEGAEEDVGGDAAAAAAGGGVGKREPKRFWDSEPQDSTIDFPVFRDGIVMRIPMGREDAFRHLEAVRVEFEAFRKAKKDQTAGDWMPWWYWERPVVFGNGDIESELKVINGAWLIGLGGNGHN